MASKLDLGILAQPATSSEDHSSASCRADSFGALTHGNLNRTLFSLVLSLGVWFASHALGLSSLGSNGSLGIGRRV
eukprot:6462868-Amphidinium_carterae.5